MVTGEAAYTHVVSAVELMPDAYIIKPFTMDALAARVKYAFDKRDALQEAYAALDADIPSFEAAITACSKLIAQKNRFALEALKVRGQALLLLKNWSEAHSVFHKVCSWRGTPWAEVGKAKAFHGAGYTEKAFESLDCSIESFPQYVAAYDVKAEILSEMGDFRTAQSILEEAHRIVPSNKRTRQLGLLAYENQNYESTTRWLEVVVKKDRYGLSRNSNDFFKLSAAYRELQKFEKALGVLESLGDHFQLTPALEVRKIAAEAMTLISAGKRGEGIKKIRSTKESMSLRCHPTAQIEIAEACFAGGEDFLGKEIVEYVANNWNEHDHVLDQIGELFDRLEKPDDGERIIRNAKEELKELNNKAVALIKKNKIEEAISLLEDVASRLEDNSTVQANAAQALLLWVDRNFPKNLMSLPLTTKPRIYLSKARDHLKNLSRANPEDNRLPPLYRHYMKLTGEKIVGIADLHDEEELEAQKAENEIELTADGTHLANFY